MPMDPQERDLLIRTVAGETDEHQPDDGLAGVGHVILNRLNSGKYGDSVASVVLAPRQFEPWQTRARELLSYTPEHPGYRRAARVVDGILTGTVPDPTGGATHFMNADVVRQRRGGRDPALSGDVIKIGDHTFHYGERPVNMARASPTVEPTIDEMRDIAKQYGIKTDAIRAPATIAEELNDIHSVLRAYGLKIPKLETPVIDPKTGADLNKTAPAASKPSKDQRLLEGAGMDYVEQALRGMPIISPLVDRGTAALSALVRPMMGSEGAPTFGERYDAKLKALRGHQEEFAKENPWSSMGANLGGGLLSMIPAAGTRVGGALLGAYGPSLGWRVMGGGAGGAGIGATDAALRDEGVGQGATIGAMGGAGGPVLGRAASGLSNFVQTFMSRRPDALRGANNMTVEKLVQGMEGETPASIQAARERMGPAGFLGDVNPAMTDLAGGVADIPGPGKTVVREAYRGRHAEQRTRIDQALTDAAGPRRNMIELKDMTTEARKQAADPLYEAWRAAEIHPTDKLKELMPRLDNAGAFKMAEELAGITGDKLTKPFFTAGQDKNFPTAQTWDYVKQGLDRKIDAAYTAGDKTLGRALVSLKHEMIEEIEKTPAGEIWKRARSEFASHSTILDQMAAGRDTLLGHRSGLSVDELRHELRGLGRPELIARIQGARDAAAEAMGETVTGDTTLRNKILAPNNQAKLRLLLGDDRAEGLIQTMRQEKYLGDQYQNVGGGSQTTPKRERVKALLPNPAAQWDFEFGRPRTWLPPSWVNEFRPSHLVDALQAQRHGTATSQLARLVTTPEGPTLDSLIRAIQEETGKRSAAAARSDRIGNAVSSLVTLPGTTTARRNYLPAQ